MELVQLIQQQYLQLGGWFTALVFAAQGIYFLYDKLYRQLNIPPGITRYGLWPILWSFAAAGLYILWNFGLFATGLYGLMFLFAKLYEHKMYPESLHPYLSLIADQLDTWVAPQLNELYHRITGAAKKDSDKDPNTIEPPMTEEKPSACVPDVPSQSRASSDGWMSSIMSVFGKMRDFVLEHKWTSGAVLLAVALLAALSGLSWLPQSILHRERQPSLLERVVSPKVAIALVVLIPSIMVSCLQNATEDAEDHPTSPPVPQASTLSQASPHTTLQNATATTSLDIAAKAASSAAGSLSMAASALAVSVLAVFVL